MTRTNVTSLRNTLENVDLDITSTEEIDAASETLTRIEKAFETAIRILDFGAENGEADLHEELRDRLILLDYGYCEYCETFKADTRERRYWKNNPVLCKECDRQKADDVQRAERKREREREAEQTTLQAINALRADYGQEPLSEEQAWELFKAFLDKPDHEETETETIDRLQAEAEPFPYDQVEVEAQERAALKQLQADQDELQQQFIDELQAIAEEKEKAAQNKSNE